jgi:2-oxoglutarate dehydrogenase complex dehydrogenase (E1) component-like enzyme
MPHRGRLNVLNDIFDQTKEVFNKIQGNSEFPLDFKGSGDVLSHLSKIFNKKKVHQFQKNIILIKMN